LKINYKNKGHVIPFGSSTRLIHINPEGNFSVVNVKLQMDQCRTIMQPYANSIKNSDFDEIFEKLWDLRTKTYRMTLPGERNGKSPK
jgi:hypothetical protein